MKLYEIDAQLEELLAKVDEETGELLCSAEDLDALMVAKKAKLEGLALWIKGQKAEAAAIREEEKKLAKRRQALEKNIDRAADFLYNYLAGEKLKTARVSVTYRNTEVADITNPELFWSNPAEAFIRRSDPEPDKLAIRAALKDGGIVPGAELVKNVSMIIK